MKNSLTHRSGQFILLSNVDDNTNRLFINGEEIPSSLWVGSGAYTQVVDGVTITIAKIYDLVGNIVLKKVTDTSFKFTKKDGAIQFSHIGQIIESTTLNTLAKVQEIYGTNTTWIQHTGYVLRGASSGVVSNSSIKTGGSDDAIVPYHRHSVSRAQLAESNGGHQHNIAANAVASQSVNLGNNYVGVGYSENNDYSYWLHGTSTGANIGLTSSNGAHQHYISAHNTDYAGTSGNTTNANIPNYKSVYIWERVS